MVKYFLFIFCSKPSSKIEEIMDNIKLISDSPKSNYILSEKTNTIIVHFSSSVDIKDLREYVYISLSEYSNFFFMTECNDSTVITMTQEHIDHLLNLDDNMTDVDHLTYNDIIENDDNEEDSDIMALKLMNSVKKNCKLPTLNEILDKISEDGIESLTKLEKEILNNYSKN